MHYITVDRDTMRGVPPALAKEILDYIRRQPGEHGALYLRGDDGLDDTYEIVVTTESDRDLIVASLKSRNITYEVRSDPPPVLDEDDEAFGPDVTIPTYGTIFMAIDGAAYSVAQAQAAIRVIAMVMANVMNRGEPVVRAAIRAIPGRTTYWVGFNIPGAAYALATLIECERKGIRYQLSEKLPGPNPNPPLQLIPLPPTVRPPFWSHPDHPRPFSGQSPADQPGAGPDEPAGDAPRPRRGWRLRRDPADEQGAPPGQDPQTLGIVRGALVRAQRAGKMLPDEAQATRKNPFAPRGPQPSSQERPRRRRGRHEESDD